MQLDKLPTESQPQPRALYLLVCRPYLPELFEHGLLILWGDADAGVADGDLNGAVLWRGPDLDPSALRRELDGIRQQVQHDLPDLSLVRLNLSQSAVDICLKCD